VYYSIDPTNPSFGLQAPVNPKVRSSEPGRTFAGNVSIDPAVAAQQGLMDYIIQGFNKGKTAVADTAQKAGPALQAAGTEANRLLGKIPKGKLLGGSAVLAGVPALMQGDIAGAAGSSGGALVGGLLGTPLGPLGIAAGSFVGSMVGGGVVNATKAALEKTPQAVSIPTPFGDLPLNASAQQLKYMQQLGELGETQYRNALGTRTSALIDLNKQISDQDYLNRQRDFPLVQAEQNADLARSQALINTQNNAYMQQMVLGTAGNMMLDAQRERGALMRQAIATNPYVTALAAPNVSIG